jgi:hypothetical protein
MRVEHRTVWQPIAVTEVVRRSRLFLGSYALLFLLLALRFTTTWLDIACCALAIVGFADMVWIVYGVSSPSRTGAEPITIDEVRDAGPEVAGYLATYLLPFLTVAEPNGRDVAAYVIFLLVTGLIYVRSEMTQINPTMYLLGRRVVHIRTTGGWDGHLIARSSVEPGDSLRTVTLNAAVRVEVRQKAQAA